LVFTRRSRICCVMPTPMCYQKRHDFHWGYVNVNLRKVVGIFSIWPVGLNLECRSSLLIGHVGLCYLGVVLDQLLPVDLL